MAVQLLQTDFSLFWGLFRVSATYNSPPQQQQQLSAEGNTSTEALIPSRKRQPAATAGDETSVTDQSAQTNQTLVPRDNPTQIEDLAITAEDTSSTHTAATAKETQDLPVERKLNGKPPSPQKAASKTRRTTSSSTRAISSLNDNDEHSEALLSRLSSQEKGAFNSFRSLCAAKGQLDRPVGIGKHDVPDGINDDATLLCASPIPCVFAGALSYIARTTLSHKYNCVETNQLYVDDSSMPANVMSATHTVSSQRRAVTAT